MTSGETGTPAAAVARSGRVLAEPAASSASMETR
jgi:hypothetical protein